MLPQPSRATQPPIPSSLQWDEPDLALGIPPEFDGDRANAIFFLSQFERFIWLNDKTRIARDPVNRAAYFLYIMRGPRITIENWVDRNSEWLDQVTSNPDILPKGMNVWEVLKADFKRSFEDHFGPQIAGIKLHNLHMKENHVDDYLANFEDLAHRAGYSLKGHLTIQLFIRGLPPKLAEACVDNERPKSFIQWTSAVRRQYPNWLRKEAANGQQEIQQAPNQAAGRRNGQNNRQTVFGGRARTSGTTSRDSNTSTTIVDTNRNATTEDDKERYRRERKCFNCGMQGHFVRFCPNRAHPGIRAGNTTEATEEHEAFVEPASETTEAEPKPTPASLAASVKDLSSDDYRSFMRALQEGQEDFLSA
jgi:hypothetical protein